MNLRCTRCLGEWVAGRQLKPVPSMPSALIPAEVTATKVLPLCNTPVANAGTCCNKQCYNLGMHMNQVNTVVVM